MTSALPPARSGDALDRTSPLSAETLSRALVRPDVAIDVVVASPERFAATMASPLRVRLALTTLLVALVFAIPFGVYFGPTRAAHVALLFIGSVLVCYPSLHVFSAYVGVPLRAEQSGGLAILTAAVASSFSLGFAPIAFFLRATIADASEARTMGPIVTGLLAVSLGAGMLHVARCIRASDLSGRTFAFGIVISGWFVLLGFISLRMARVLGLAG